MLRIFLLLGSERDGYLACGISLNNYLERLDWMQHALVIKLLFVEGNPLAPSSCESACVPWEGQFPEQPDSACLLWVQRC